MKKIIGAAAAIALAAAVAAGGTGAALAASSSAMQPAVAVKMSVLNTTQDKVRILAAVPEFSGFKGAEALNRQIGFGVRCDISAVKESAKDLGESSADLTDHLYYSTWTDYSQHGQYLSVWTGWESYTGGAHGSHGIVSRTMNAATGEFLNNPNFLFRDPNAGADWLTKEVLSRMAARTASGDAFYFEDAQDTVKKAHGAFNYYLDGDNLVIYFGLYEIAPYAAGIQSFTIPLSSVPSTLPLAVSLTGGSGHGELSVNGKAASALSAPKDVDGVTYVPLKETASLLGLTVLTADGVSSVNGKVPETVKTVDQLTYVPLAYFSETLGEFALNDGNCLHLCRKDSIYAAPAAGTVPFCLSDTTADLSVDGEYTFRITASGNEAPSFVVGTPGVFESELVEQQGTDFYYRVTSIGKPGSKAGIYIGGGSRLLVASVKSNANYIFCDTEKPFSLKQGKTYQFMLKAGAEPRFVCGNANVFLLTFAGFSGRGEYYYTATAIGKPGQCAGFYIGSEKSPRVIVTVAAS